MHNGATRNAGAALATPAGVTHDLLDKNRTTGTRFRAAAVLFAALFVLGIVGFVIRMQDGVSDRAVWGYHAALFAFILTAAQGAPMVAIATRLAKAHWRRPISRTAELFTVVGLFNLILFIPLLWVLPGLDDGRRTLWFFSQDGVWSYTPHVWATIGLVSLILSGIALLWVSALPDLAAVRDSSTGRRQRLFARLAFGWHGTSKQWHMMHRRLDILGVFYFMMLVCVHFLISIDFAMALVPGWIDALFPATHAFISLQAGVATVMIAMFVLRRFGGYEEYIGVDQFWGLGKILFALSLLWIWFWFSSFIVFWYGKKPSERSVLDLLMVGPYLPIFIASFVLSFFFPFVAMIWNPVRKSVWGPTLVAVSVLIGTFFDRVRIYVAAYSVPGIGDPLVEKHELHDIPSTVMPGLPDVLIWIGAISGSILVYMVAMKIFPPISIWEQKEMLLYRVHKRFHRTEVVVLGKPD
jgi:molybdopterin-containing oxidoreductase family membrane subunit